MQGKTGLYIGDKELVEMLKAGNNKAFEQLYDRFAPLIFAVLNMANVGEQKAEEVIANTFAQIKEEIAKPDWDKTRLFIWVLNIARQSMKGSCTQELQLFKNQNRTKYVNNGGEVVKTAESWLVQYILTTGVNYTELAQLTGFTRQELMVIVKEEIARLKK